MRQTLFFIPHDINGIPVFGFGWLLLAWAAFCVLLLAWLVRRQGWNAETRSYLPVVLVVGAAIWFLLPQLEEGPAGLPIRGYGVMLLIAVVSGVLLASYQARRMGLDPEQIYSLAFWMFLAGIVGARVFFVVQYWEQFPRDNLFNTVAAVLSVTKGGLVVYGSVIGGLAAGLWFCHRRRLPVLAVADLIAPSMVLGLAIGRLGCLLNGCCFGGLCSIEPLGLTFPKDSPPYLHQLQQGTILGVQLRHDPQNKQWIVEAVEAEGLAAGRGIKAGDAVRSLGQMNAETLEPVYHVELADGRQLSWPLSDLPGRSRPVHPTQIYSSINAALMFFFMWSFYPFRRHDGQVFSAMLIVYAIARFLLEIIRDDVGQLFGTTLTISQWASVFVLAGGIAVLIYAARSGTQPAFPPVEASD